MLVVDPRVGTLIGINKKNEEGMCSYVLKSIFDAKLKTYPSKSTQQCHYG